MQRVADSIFGLSYGQAQEGFSWPSFTQAEIAAALQANAAEWQEVATLADGLDSTQGGFPINKPPSSSQGQLKPSDVLVSKGGEDAFRVAAYVLWGDSFASRIAQFEACKQAAGDETQPGEPFFFIGPTVFVVGPRGTSAGGSCGPRYAWTVKAEGITFLVMNRDNHGDGKIANVRIELGSLLLMKVGLRAAYARALELLKLLGVDHVDCCKVSRVDLCVDLPGVPVARFADLEEAGCVITLARQSESYKRLHVRTGFSYGKGTRLRAYDKLREVTVDNRDDEKLAVIIAGRCGGVVPEHLTRIEFQLDRDMLKTLGVDTVEDYLCRRAGIWRFMCREWFRMTTVEPDRENKNHQRAETHPLWEQVEAMGDETFTDVGEPGILAPINRVDRSGLPGMIAGCLASLAADHGIEISACRRTAAVQLREVLAAFVMPRVKGDKLARANERKRRMLVASRPPGCCVESPPF